MKILHILFFYFTLVLVAYPVFAKTGENEKALASFKNNPPREAWSFAVVGDSSLFCQACDWINDKVFADMEKNSFDFAVHVGDFIDSGTEEEYVGYLNHIGSLKFPMVHIPGNHDVSPDDQSDASLFKKYFGRPYYYFDYQNARFIMLNNAQHEFGDGQRAWLDKTLAGAKGRLKFVFMHVPIFNPSRRRAYLIKWDEDIKPFEEIVRRHKVDIIFTGHLHFFNDSIHEGVRTIITGGGGDFLYEIPENGGFYHWIKINIKGGTVKTQVMKVPFPLSWETLYRTFFFFNYDVRDNLKLYIPIFLLILLTLSGILLKIRRTPKS